LTRVDADFGRNLLFGRLNGTPWPAIQKVGCPTKEVDDFVRVQASDDGRRQRSTTWVFTDDAEIVGYVTLLPADELGVRLARDGEGLEPASLGGRQGHGDVRLAHIPLMISGQVANQVLRPGPL
jgi:hypothetical protein